MKIFCIGLSKTGTTSLNKALNILGIKSTHELHGGSPHYNDYLPRLLAGNFSHNIWSDFQAFTDIPIPLFYQQLDEVFPNSRFILTVRNKRDWVNSAECYFSQMYKKPAGFSTEHKRSLKIPCTDFVRVMVYGMAKFNRSRYLSVYVKHNREVWKYFKKRRQDLLVLNISGGDGWKELCRFLRKPVPKTPFPCENVQ